MDHADAADAGEGKRMTMTALRCEAFVLSCSSAAISQAGDSKTGAHPMVQIIGAGNGATVVGIDALMSLKQAIEFALRETK